MNLKIGKHDLVIDPDKYNIECIILFGSYAYNEADDKSDIDLIIIVNDHSSKRILMYRKSIASAMGIPRNWLEIYNRGTFKRSTHEGGVFLNSVKNYGKILYSRSDFINKIFDNMPLNNKTKAPLYRGKKHMQSLIRDYKSRKVGPVSTISNIAFYLRQLCIDICYLNGIVEVRKYDAVKQCFSFDNLDIPFTLSDYKELYDIKRNNSSSKWGDIPKVTSEYIMKWYKNYITLLNQVL